MATREPKDAEHRRSLRDLNQQGQSALTWGLPNPVTEAAIVGVGLMIRERLEEASNDARASAAGQIASQLLDKTAARMQQAASFACKRGCSFCCHSAVAVSAPEVFQIVRALSNGAAGSDTALTRDDVLARCKAGAGETIDAIFKRNAPARFSSTAHAASTMCARSIGRQYFSTSVQGCEEASEGKRDEFPFVGGALNLGVMVRSLLLAAMHSLGRGAETYELSSALASVLDIPDAERSWLAGEDVFSGALIMPHSPNMQASVDRWSPMLVSLLEGE